MKYQDCYVAFLDILGFKDMIRSASADQIMRVFQSITQGKEAKEACFRAYEEEQTLKRYNQALNRTKIQIMSDSIVLSTPAASRESLAAIINMCNVIQQYLYECEPVILLRGAIARGNLYHKKDLVFGQGMVDAYLAQEKISLYPRIILRGDLLKYFEDVAQMWDGRSLLKRDEDGYYYIDCLYDFLNNNFEALFRKHCSRIERYLGRYLDRYISPDIREKLLWMEGKYKECVKEICEEKGFSEMKEAAILEKG